MSGPRVTSGTESKQDYSTPIALIKSCEQRFGQISFDLAAHASNKQHPRYFAPTHFSENIETEIEIHVDDLKEMRSDDVSVDLVKYDKKKKLYVYEKKTVNRDPEAFAMDAFAHSWADLSTKFGKEHTSGRALLWDNCEFNDIPRWAARHLEEMKKGANSLLLTPLTTANWYRDFMAGKADVYHLSGRLSFDGKNVFPKDCCITHYQPGCKGDLFLWDWANDRILESWNHSRP